MVTNKPMDYEYQIKTQELIPPVGEYRFMAFCLMAKSGIGKINVNFGDVWGKTKEEAVIKMEDKVKEWIKQNDNV